MVAALWAAVAVLVVVVVLVSLVSFELLRRHGEVLERLDELEDAVASAGSGGGDGPASPAPPVGAALPAFELPDLDGRRVSLADFRGQRLLLVHWDPSCRYCAEVAPALARAQPELERCGLRALLVSHGDVAGNRAMAERHDLDLPIVLQENGAVVEAFARMGTPVAYLVDEHGRLARPAALGSQEVPKLLAEAVAGRRRLAAERPLSQSRLRRDGLQPGETAPDFVLDDLDGRRVSLDSYRGQRLLLVFSDPNCGPCQELMPSLAELERRHGGAAASVVLVSRGDREENREKARRHGVHFPVVIQPGWSLSKQYGIFATPVAFLVDRDGRVAAEVAKGSEEVLALARQALAPTPAPAPAGR
jgi:peroxiredoxin